MLASYAAMSGYFAGNREQSGHNEQSGSNETKRQPAVAALGRIEPRSEIINIGAGFSPDRLESLFVARGDLVKALPQHLIVNKAPGASNTKCVPIRSRLHTIAKVGVFTRPTPSDSPCALPKNDSRGARKG